MPPRLYPNWFFLANSSTLELIIYLPSVKSHCRLPLPLVHWSDRKKTTHAMYNNWTDVCQRSMETLACILFHLHSDQWLTRVITQVATLNRFIHYWFFFHLSNSHKIARLVENISREFWFCCVRDFQEDLIKIQLIRVFPRL